MKMPQIIKNVDMEDRDNELRSDVFPQKPYEDVDNRSNNTHKEECNMNYDAAEAQSIFNEIDMEMELHVNAVNGGQ